MNRPKIVDLVINDLMPDTLPIKEYTTRLEQECAHLKSKLATHQRMLAGGILYSYRELATHDAEVIDKAAKEIIKKFGYANGGSWVIDASDIKDYVNRLHQKTQESNL